MGRTRLARLERASAENVEGLVGAAQLYIRFQGDGVVALHQSVHEFVDVDGVAALNAVVEGVAGRELLDGEVGGQMDHVGEGHLTEPLAVATHFGAFWIEQFERLIAVGGCVGLQHFSRLHGAEGIFVRRIADESGEVADQEDRLMSELLEQGQLAQRDAMADVQVGRCWIDAEVDAQRSICEQRFGQPLVQFGVHRSARGIVAEGGAAHDQRVLPLDFCGDFWWDMLSGLIAAHAPALDSGTMSMSANSSRAASRSRPICSTRASMPSNLRSPRSRWTNSTRRSAP